MAGLGITSMGLKGNALLAATELQKRCPGIVFTSGTRGIKDQARAMAKNIVADKTYLVKTYKPSKAKDACVAWCGKNQTTTAKDVEAGLLEVFGSLGDGDLQKISRHLGGLAFDVKPGSADLDVVRKVVEDLFGGEFLDHEGKLCRWHAQFSDGPAPSRPGDDPPETGMDKTAMKLLLAKAKKQPLNCAVGLSADGRLALLVMHRSRKPRTLVRDLKGIVKGAKTLRWGTVAVNWQDNGDEEGRTVEFMLNKTLSNFGRKLRKTLVGTGFSKVRVGVTGADAAASARVG